MSANTSQLTEIDPDVDPTTNPTTDVEFMDGSIDGIVLERPSKLGEAALLSVGLPSSMRQQQVGGRYFLARCGAQTIAERQTNWQIYLRRPLFACRIQPQFGGDAGVPQSAGGEIENNMFDRWDLLIPPGNDPGYDWLRTLSPGSTVNLIGPLGQGFSLSPQTRNLLLLTQPDRLAALLPTINEMLDQNGRVTLVLHDDQRTNPTPLLALLPLAVEVHLADSFDQWRRNVDDFMTWADQICVCMPRPSYRTLADIIRQRRFRLEPGFAQMLVEADLVCGTGACLACVVPSANGGVTRACVHGPVMDLTRLVER